MSNLISKEYNFKELIRYAWPTIAMFIFMSLYTIIDAFFVARYVGDDAVAAINIVYPAFQIFSSFGLLIGTGGCAILAKKIGEKQYDKVHGYFTSLCIIGIVITLVLMIICFGFKSPLLTFLGNTPRLDKYCQSYYDITLLFAPIIMIKYISGNVIMAAGQPKLGLKSSILGGILNIGLDFLFVAVFKLGISGAAIATYLAMAGSAWICLRYLSNQSANIHFAKPIFDKEVIFKTIGNGSSEMVTQLSVGITTLLFNRILLKLSGEAGVTAICIILYIQYIMLAVFLGFMSGVAPLVSYNYGARNHLQLQKLLKYCLSFILITTIIVLLLAYTTPDLLLRMFVNDKNTYALTKTGILIFSISYIFNGFTIFVASWFTALNNGKVSAFLSFFKNLFLVIVLLITLPKILGVIGVWLAVPIAEAIATIVSIITLIIYKKRYCY